MQIRTIGLCAVLALGANTVFAEGGEASEAAALKEQAARLRAQVNELEAQRREQLRSEIDNYLADTKPWRGSEGSSWTDSVQINFKIAAVGQATADLSPRDAHAVDGMARLELVVDISENLQGFITIDASTTTAVNTDLSTDLGFLVDKTGANGQRPPGIGISNPSGSGFPTHFGSLPPRPTDPPGVLDGVAIGTRTMSGFTDGIGVNSLQPTQPGSAVVYETGMTHTVNEFTWQAGALDPRTRFGQNNLTENYWENFLNNLWIDSPGVLWLTDSSGRRSLGLYGTYAFDDEWSAQAGWFNAPGQFFSQGQFYFQLTWDGIKTGKRFSVRIFGFIDEFFRDRTGDGAAGGGFSAEWHPPAWHAGTGVFFKGSSNSGAKFNPVETDLSIGVVLTGVFKGRPDDILGVGVGFIEIRQDSEFGVFPSDTETTFELFYRFTSEGGNLQVTPHFMLVSDAGGGLGWIDDTLLMLGLRIMAKF
ncbi:MAG: carbohydrate porin [Planctomycetota bacterium]